MALSTRTMTDEQRKSVAIEYLRAFDNGGKTSDGRSILDLFADDAHAHVPQRGLAHAQSGDLPKMGLGKGNAEIGQCFGDVGGTLKSITPHFSHFNFIFSGSDMV